MSRETVVCTSIPRRRRASTSSPCVDSDCSWTIRRIAPCRSYLFTIPAPSTRNCEAASELSLGRDLPRRRPIRTVVRAGSAESTPRSAQASTTSPASVSTSLPSNRPAPRAFEAARTHHGLRSPTLASSSSVIAVSVVHGCAGEGVPPNGVAWSCPARTRPTWVSATRALRGESVGRPHRRARRQRGNAQLLEARNEPVRPRRFAPRRRRAKTLHRLRPRAAARKSTSPDGRRPSARARR